MDCNSKLPTFRDWLYTKQGDLTSGKLYPYLKSKPVYQCPTDRLELAAKKRPQPFTSTFGPNGNRTAPRNYSYAMNCGLCHTTDLSSFLEPSKTVIYLEGALAPDDYSGQVGPLGTPTQALSYRHKKKGHLIMADLRIEKMDRAEVSRVATTKRF